MIESPKKRIAERPSLLFADCCGRWLSTTVANAGLPRGWSPLVAVVLKILEHNSNGVERKMNEKQTCPDCGTGLGRPHVNQCDVERCSSCDGQRITYDYEDHAQASSSQEGVMVSDQKNNTTPNDKSPNCPGCAVAVGQPHESECEVEQCSVCHDQRCECNCAGHNSCEVIWEGETPDYECGGVLCEHCHGPAKCVVAKVRLDDFDDEQWTQYQKGWLRIAPRDEESVKFLCENCS